MGFYAEQVRSDRLRLWFFPAPFSHNAVQDTDVRKAIIFGRSCPLSIYRREGNRPVTVHRRPISLYTRHWPINPLTSAYPKDRESYSTGASLSGVVGVPVVRP